MGLKEVAFKLQPAGTHDVLFRLAAVEGFEICLQLWPRWKYLKRCEAQAFHGPQGVNPGQWRLGPSYAHSWLPVAAKQ